MEQTFKYVGVATNIDGRIKMRFANDLIRTKVMMKHGDSDIHFVELPEASLKPVAVTFLKTTDLYANPKFTPTVDEAFEKYCVATVKTTKTAKAAKSPAKSPEEKMAGLKDRASKKTAVSA
jgi:hypothetical protein